MEKLEEIHKEILNGNMDILKDFPLLYCLSENKENFVVLRKGRIVKEENHIKYFFPNSESNESNGIYCLIWGRKNEESYGIGGTPVPDDFYVTEMKFENDRLSLLSEKDEKIEASLKQFNKALQNIWSNFTMEELSNAFRQAPAVILDEIKKEDMPKTITIKNFDKFPIPLRIIATNLNTGETKAFSEGDIAKILVASMAIPTIFEPVEIEGNVYVDGLVSRNLPVEEAYDMGADLVIASDIGAPIVKKDNYNILSVLSQMSTIQSSNITNISRGKASILISPNIKDISAIDSSKKNDLINLGKIAAEEQVSKLKKLPKNSSNIERAKVQKEKKDSFVINKIEYDTKFDKNTIDIFQLLLQGLYIDSIRVILIKTQITS